MKRILFLAAAAAGIFVSVDCAGQVKGPEAWFEFMGGNVRKDGLVCDLEAIKSAGFSGVHFFHVHRNDGEIWPGCEKQIPCMSGDWFGLMEFFGKECKRLGLELTVQNCPGWSQSGGPWVDLDHCQRDIEMSRMDYAKGDKFSMPPVPERFRDADSDWRDVAVLAFPTPEGDENGGVLKPVETSKIGDSFVYRFGGPVTVRSVDMQPCDTWNVRFSYHQPWIRVKVERMAADGWEEVFVSPVPTSNWRDYVLPLTLSCGEKTASEWRVSVEYDREVKKFTQPVLRGAARHTDWQGKSARTLRSLLRETPPEQSPSSWVDLSKVIDLTGKTDWIVPEGRWTVVRVGHVNAKRVNAPAPKEATGWECDKLDPSGIEACFNGYIRRLNDGVLKGNMSGVLVDSWECFGQTWTPKMEKYFFDANGYGLRRWIPALFGWIVASPAETESFLFDWRRTIGNLITKNYFGRLGELSHEAGLKVYFETAFGDVVYGDLLEYWKYSDDPICEFWVPHRSKDYGGVGSYSFKAIRPCASAAHIYGKRRVMAEAFTGSGIRWSEDFREFRDVANRHLAKGVTHLAFQNYTHAPLPNALPPGGCLGGYNGTPFTRLQTWWKHMPHFTAWLTKCEELLEEGVIANDVLWYLGDAVDHKPDDYYAFPEGYGVDYLNHDVLTNRLSVMNGLFTVPEGTTWKVLWVPDEYFMLPATKKRLAELSADGGKVVFGGKDALEKALLSIGKDVETAPSLGDGLSEDFMWLHRKIGTIDRYFVAAGTNGYRGKVTFRANGVSSIFDPVSGEWTAWVNGTEIELYPSQSVFVEFGMEAGNPPAKDTGKPCIGFGPWKLSFAQGWGAPPSVEIGSLMPWTDIPSFSREAKAYCGTVAYETEFDIGQLPDGARCVLDLGRVETVADVFVNGKNVRTLWCEPYACDVSGFVKPGRNSLRIEVTNTWRNRIVYDLAQSEDKRKTWILYRKNFNPSPESPFIPAGLIGPAVLRFQK